MKLTPLDIQQQQFRTAFWGFDKREVDALHGRKVKIFDVDVPTRSEQGLLGLALHPNYLKNKRFFLNYSVQTDAGRFTRVAEWRGDLAGDAPPTEHAVLLEVAQPWPNHNAGQLRFGPDGMLYVGFGDGGAANDPQGHGQNLQTLLGGMLRLDVDHPDAGKAYGIPKDNPFVGRADARPELWAWGLRNPWRYAFAPDGRLVVGDVGQNAWEEITVVGRGENHGWNTREAAHCFPPDSACDAKGMVDPIYEYPHGPLGSSITGGVVYGGALLKGLAGKYVFGDFGSGRLWALDLPAAGQPAVPTDKAWALGRFDLQPTAFGLDDQGELYVGDYGAGVLYRVRPAP